MNPPTQNPEYINKPEETDTVAPVNISTTGLVVEDYNGFSVRKCKKGYLAFQGGRLLETRKTVEGAVASIDEYLERERQAAIRDAELAELQAKRAAEQAEQERKKLEAVLACIQPIRDFTEKHGLNMLRDCLERLELEERERNVPPNWEELVEIADQIAEKRSQDDGWGTDQVGDVEVTKYGVTEHRYYNSDLDDYALHQEYGLQEYIDEFSYILPEDEEEEQEEAAAASEVALCPQSDTALQTKWLRDSLPQK